MENQIVLLDTSILIDYYRKKDKSKSVLFKLSQNNQSFAVSTVSLYEIYIGAETTQIEFWDNFFAKLTIIPFDKESSKTAVEIYKDLKQRNKLIEMPDLFIAATALTNELSCATLNRKHFERVVKIKIIDV